MLPRRRHRAATQLAQTGVWPLVQAPKAPAPAYFARSDDTAQGRNYQRTPISSMLVAVWVLFRGALLHESSDNLSQYDGIIVLGILGAVDQRYVPLIRQVANASQYRLYIWS